LDTCRFDRFSNLAETTETPIEELGRDVYGGDWQRFRQDLVAIAEELECRKKLKEAAWCIL